MHKVLCVAVLLLPTFVLSQESGAAKSSTAGLPAPVIVAKAKLKNQSAAIPTTTIYTPAQDGLYRLSVYATMTTNNEFSQSQWQYGIAWTDDDGAQSTPYLLYQGGNVLGQFWSAGDQINPMGGEVLSFEAKAGTPITHNMTQNGPPDGTLYSLYYTLERLE
jgi:hypothetical protein